MSVYCITGGAGFIGSHIATLALEQGHEVIILDDLSTGTLDNLAHIKDHASLTIYQRNICEPETYQAVLKDVDHMIHCAAKISVAESMDHPDIYEQVNVIGTQKLLDACKQAGVKSFVLSSSAAVYGDNPVLPKIESMLPEPKSPYADGKLKGEQLLQAANEPGKFRAVSLRYFNVFGPRQDPHSPYAAAIPHFIDQALQNNDITIFGDGQQTRDFIYVGDIAQANLLASEQGEGVINAANGGALTIQALAEKIKQHLGSSSNIVFGPDRPGDIKHSQADCSKLRAQFPNLTTKDFDAALGETIDYYAQR